MRVLIASNDTPGKTFPGTRFPHVPDFDFMIKNDENYRLTTLMKVVGWIPILGFFREIFARPGCFYFTASDSGWLPKLGGVWHGFWFTALVSGILAFLWRAVL